MEYFPLAISCGSYVFSLTFYPTASQIPHIISLVCSSVNFIFPTGKLNKIICKVEHPIELFKTYEEVRILISDEYDRCNPITSDKANLEWRKFVKGKKSNPLSKFNPNLIHKNRKWHS